MGEPKVERSGEAQQALFRDEGSIPSSSTKETVAMDFEAIKANLEQAKDHLFRDARAVCEWSGAIYPMFGALMPDGQMRLWNIGPVPEPMIPAALYKAAQEIKEMGAVGALFFADGEFHASDKEQSDSECRSLFCYLTTTYWEEVWTWGYKDTSAGWEWSGEKPGVEATVLRERPFAPFPQADIMRGAVH